MTNNDPLATNLSAPTNAVDLNAVEPPSEPEMGPGTLIRWSEVDMGRTKTGEATLKGSRDFVGYLASIDRANGVAYCREADGTVHEVPAINVFPR